MRGSFWPKEYTFEEYKKLYPHIINENHLIQQYNLELNNFLQEQQQRKINIASNVFQTNLLGELNQIQLQEDVNKDDWRGSGFQVLYGGSTPGGASYAGYNFNYPEGYTAPSFYFLELKQFSGSEGLGVTYAAQTSVQETCTARIANNGVFRTSSDSEGDGFTSMTAYIGEKLRRCFRS